MLFFGDLFIEAQNNAYTSYDSFQTNIINLRVKLCGNFKAEFSINDLFSNTKCGIFLGKLISPFRMSVKSNHLRPRFLLEVISTDFEPNRIIASKYRLEDFSGNCIKGLNTDTIVQSKKSSTM